MVFYRTKRDYVPAVLKTQILFQLLIKHRANKRDMVFFSTHRNNARSVVITSPSQEDHGFFMFQIDIKLQLLL